MNSIVNKYLLAVQVRIGKSGVEEVYDLGSLSAYEKKALDAMIPELKSSIQKGVDFAA